MGTVSNRVETNPMTGEKTLIATGSSTRPRDHGATGTCNFCPGNETTTGRETGRVQGPGGWSARAWLNPWAVVDQDGELTGSHEVATFSPEHTRTLGELTDNETDGLAELLAQRYTAHAEGGHAATHLLVNHGASSGRSVIHPHLQMYVLDQVPPKLAVEQENLRAGQCVLCRELADLDPDLVVAETETTIVHVPRWASKDGELLVAPRTHSTPMADLVAGLVLAARATEGEEGISYHVGGHAAPYGTEMHEHIHLTPHPERACGVGTHTGITVVRNTPQAAAARLRRQLAAQS